MKPFILSTLILFSCLSKPFTSLAQTYNISYYQCDGVKPGTCKQRHDSAIVRSDTSYYIFDFFRFFPRIKTVTRDTTWYTNYSCMISCNLCDSCMHIDTIPALAGITYGVFFLDVGAPAKIANARAMGSGITMLRYNVNADDATYQVQQLKDSGYKVIMTYNWRKPKDPAGFPVGADLAAFGNRLNYLLGISSPEVVCIQNEMFNQNYYPRTNPNNTAANYTAMLDVAIPIAHAHGVKISDGGILHNVEYNYIQDLLARGLTDSAHHVMAMLGIVNMNAPIVQDAIAGNNVILDYEKMHAVDYTNFHYYQQTPYLGFMIDMIKWINKRTGKPVITNEFGTYDNNASTLITFLNDLKAGGALYEVYYAPGNYKPDAPAKDNREVVSSWLLQ